MQYLADHGTYADIPVDKILAAWEEAYGKEKVQSWIALHQQSKGKPVRDFYKEEIVK